MEAELSREDLLKFYRQMNVIREMELAARELYQSKKIRGFLHLFVGQVSWSQARTTDLDCTVSRTTSLLTPSHVCRRPVLLVWRLL